MVHGTLCHKCKDKHTTLFVSADNIAKVFLTNGARNLTLSHGENVVCFPAASSKCSVLWNVVSAKLALSNKHGPDGSALQTLLDRVSVFTINLD